MAKKAKKAVKVKKTAGQPTKYKAAYVDTVFKLCLLNATDAQIADVFDVTEATLWNWKKKYPAFFDAIKRGKLKADADVGKSLHDRAVGYSHPDVHISNFQGAITITPITKHYPPDTAAMCFWLKNRQGWKDKAEVVVTDDRITTEERLKMRDIMKSRQALKLVKGA